VKFVNKDQPEDGFLITIQKCAERHAVVWLVWGITKENRTITSKVER